LRTNAQARFDLGDGVPPISVSDYEIGGGLQQREKNDKKEQQPAPETSKFQG
jgi:hypothetical protein